jgi:hypothetical protein
VLEHQPPAVLPAGISLVSPLEASEYFKGLFYGIPGTGKTVLCGTAEDVPEMRDVLVVDAERGTRSIRQRGKYLKVFHLKTLDDMERLLGALVMNQLPQYHTIVLDSISSIHAMLMRAAEERLRRTSKSGIVDGRQVYGEAGRDLELLLKTLYDMPVHLLATAHEQEKEDDQTKIKTVTLSLPGQMQNVVPRYFDLVGRLYIYAEFQPNNPVPVLTQRRLLTAAHYKYLAKDRSGMLGFEVIDPTMAQLLSMSDLHLATVQEADEGVPGLLPEGLTLSLTPVGAGEPNTEPEQEPTPTNHTKKEKS